MANYAAFLEKLNSSKPLVSDGATGTNLQKRGLPVGKPAEAWMMDNPEVILQLHRDFVEAGSDIILTNSFGGTRVRLEQFGLADKVVEINRLAVELARKAAGEHILVAGSMGPTGHLLKPLGPLEVADASTSYTEQARALIEGGVDLLLLETHFDLNEAKTAIAAIRGVSEAVPVVCSFSYDRGSRTMMGVKPTQMGKEIGSFGVNMLGVNCGRSLEDNLNVLKELKLATNLPVWFKPNAGLPKVDDEGNAFYDIGPEDMASHVSEWLEAGAKVIGGCCGTSPEHVKQIALQIKKYY